MNIIYSLDYSKKELQAIGMKKKIGWTLFFLALAISAYGWVLFLARDL